MGIPSNGGIQQMNVITEGDIYRLTAKSELPGAEKFESWIFDEVLPSIRKTGSYQVNVEKTTGEKLMDFISELPNNEYKNIAIIKIIDCISNTPLKQKVEMSEKAFRSLVARRNRK